ncbi:MAG: lauroyl-Kdo(2)-lipid IV(A) myristoyltransferase [Candidatus Symbiodolus clandestinus]
MDHRPTFKVTFLCPRYWGYWLLPLALSIVVLIPLRWRDPWLAACGRYLGRRLLRPRQRASVNLCYCFPQWSEDYREQILDQMFATAAQVAIAMVELAVRSRSYLLTRIQIVGENHLTTLQQQGKPILFFVPHVWGIDFAAVTLAALGLPMAAMIKPHPNPLIEWLSSRTRLRFGGRLYTRQQGLKPWTRAVRNGYLGYYLPDEDHGTDKSEFVDFFATYKATLPVLAPLAKICRAEVLPLLPVYKTQQGAFELQIFPPMDFSTANTPNAVARQLNQVIETLITPYPEQYLWVLKLLKTRKPRESMPYE